MKKTEAKKSRATVPLKIQKISACNEPQPYKTMATIYILRLIEEELSISYEKLEPARSLTKVGLNRITWSLSRAKNCQVIATPPPTTSLKCVWGGGYQHGVGGFYR